MNAVRHTCYTLKMNQFIRVLLGEEALPEWEEIYSEYIGLRENKSTSFILDILKSITYLQTKQYIIGKCVEVLAHTYSRELVMELKLTGCKGKFDYSDPGGYSNDLRAAISYSKKFNTQIAKKEKELQEYNERYKGASITRKDFEIWGVTLGKYNNQYIDFDIVTVARFCEMVNQYERFCEVENSKNNNLLNKK